MCAALALWLNELRLWNRTHDLTAARSDDELLDLMLADAFVLSKAVAHGGSVVDVGVGAGAPGLALAVMRPDLVVTLVEPLVKRVSFLRVVLGKLEREDVKVLSQKGETLTETFDVALSRATLPPKDWLTLGGRMVTPGGAVLVLLAREEPPTDPLFDLEETTRYDWPRTGASRTLCRYRRR